MKFDPNLIESVPVEIAVASVTLATAAIARGVERGKKDLSELSDWLSDFNKYVGGKIAAHKKNSNMEEMMRIIAITNAVISSFKKIYERYELMSMRKAAGTAKYTLH